MVDKSPEFLQSTPGFPGELKMGIFVKRGDFGGLELAGGWVRGEMCVCVSVNGLVGVVG